MAIKSIDFNGEIQYLGNIKSALEQVNIKGADAVIFANVLQAIETLGKAIDDKQKDINKQLSEPASNVEYVKPTAPESK